jgi:hypothetical protein
MECFASVDGGASGGESPPVDGATLPSTRSPQGQRMKFGGVAAPGRGGRWMGSVRVEAEGRPRDARRRRRGKRIGERRRSGARALFIWPHGGRL